MKLSERTRTRLRHHINGDGEDFQLGGKYRSGPKLVSLFNEFGFNGVYADDFPSRWTYTEDRLRDLNENNKMARLISTVFDRLEYEADDIFYDQVLTDINRYLERDGYRLEALNGKISILTAGATNVTFAVPASAEIASSEYIQDNVDKCRLKLGTGDYSGAITNARSLCEDVLFEIEKISANLK